MKKLECNTERLYDIIPHVGKIKLKKARALNYDELYMLLHSLRPSTDSEVKYLEQMI